jgi:hypothetical protein
MSDNDAMATLRFDFPEMAVRLAEAMHNARRPPGRSTGQILDAMHKHKAAELMRGAQAMRDYFEEVIAQAVFGTGKERVQ